MIVYLLSVYCAELKNEAEKGLQIGFSFVADTKLSFSHYLSLLNIISLMVHEIFVLCVFNFFSVWHICGK